jgi:choline dehydrogenase-like flavoprotein
MAELIKVSPDVRGRLELDKKQFDARSWPWPDSLDAVIAAGNHHRVLLENDRVRVLEVRIPRGDTVPVHTHRWPSTVYVVSASNFVRRDGDGKVLFDSRKTGTPPESAMAQWLPPLPPHSVENVGDSEILLISTELKEPGN